MREQNGAHGRISGCVCGSLAPRGALFAGLFLSILLLLTFHLPAADAASVASPQCAWVFSVYEGETLTSVLKRQWNHDACDGKYVTLKTVAPALPGFGVPSAHLLVVQYTPSETGLREGEVRYVSQEVAVTCDVFTPLCEKATVYYVVQGTVTSEPTTTTTEAPTEVPTEEPTTTTTTTTTEAPTPLQPTCPVDDVLPVIEAETKVPASLEPLSYVDNCVAPQRFTITSVSDMHEDYFSIGEDNILWFDRNGENLDEGVFQANLTIYCNEIPYCFDVQATFIVVKPTTPPSPEIPPPNCTLGYGFHASFSEHVSLTITPHEGDSCPSGSSTVFTLVSLPKHNPEEFKLDKYTGEFDYIAPVGPGVTSDDFVFVIDCITKTDSDGDDVMNHSVCVGRASILITSSPTPKPDTSSTGDGICPGNFVFDYDEAVDETNGISKTYNLFMKISSDGDDSFCSGSNYTSANIESTTVNGTLTRFNDKTGEFQYMPSGRSEDHFDFTLTCDTGSVCHGTARMKPIKNPNPTPETPSTVYNLGNIICRGTCDADAWRSSPRYPGLFDVTAGPDGGGSHVTPRRDGKLPDDMDFEIHMDGDSLLLRSYTIIGNMAARFVTFTPIGSTGSEFLTSSSVPKGANPSFNAVCLDQQAEFGDASSIWTWDGEKDSDDGASLRGHINAETNAYKSGENYFQKFGGKHRGCDVFRIDPCKYAPMLTPISRRSTANSDNNNDNDDGEPAIDWRLYVNNCDATWVGNISLHRLRMLRNSETNEPLFKTVNSSLLEGTIYSQVVKPASWVPPYRGILSTHRAYTLSISIQNSVATDFEVHEIKYSAVKMTGVKSRREEQEIQRMEAKVSSVVELPRSSSDSSKDFFNVSADVRFVSGEDSKTRERLYGYSILLYPYQLNYSRMIYSVPMLVHLDATQAKLTEVQLLNFSWKSPNLQECDECTGKMLSCLGSGSGLNLDCDSIIRFEAAGRVSLFSQLDVASARKDQFLNISLVARVVGNGTSKSATSYPEGFFSLRLHFANSETIDIRVEQMTYMTTINSMARLDMCRSSAYWPVPDVLGESVPVRPFNNTQTLYDSLPGAAKKKKDGKLYYGPPKPLHDDAFCAAGNEARRPRPVVLTKTTSVVQEDGTTHPEAHRLELSLCTAPDKQVYGVTDWVYVTLTDRQNPLDVSTLREMSLEYLILSVDADDVLGGIQPGDKRSSTTREGDSRLNFVLDGNALPDKLRETESYEKEEEEHWMSGKTAVMGKSTEYLPWEKYAAYLHYRRVHLCLPQEDKSASECVEDPFHFSFIPGTLLHRDNSKTRVKFTLYAGLRYTPASGNGTSWVEEHVAIIPVSSKISSDLRFDLDVYTPRVTPESSGGLGKKSFRALFIVLFLLIVGVLAFGVYIETHYKRLLHSTRRRLRDQLIDNKINPRASAQQFSPRQDSNGMTPLNGRGGRSASASAGMSPENGLGDRDLSPAPGFRTKYGLVQLEPTRVLESDEEFSRAESAPTAGEVRNE